MFHPSVLLYIPVVVFPTLVSLYYSVPVLFTSSTQCSCIIRTCIVPSVPVLYMYSNQCSCIIPVQYPVFLYYTCTVPSVSVLYLYSTQCSCIIRTCTVPSVPVLYMYSNQCSCIIPVQYPVFLYYTCTVLLHLL